MQRKADIIKTLRNFCTVIALFLILVTSAACVKQLPQPTPTPIESISVDPVFKNYYDFLGGEKTLGDVISPLIQKDGVNYQYSVNALMAFDPQAPVSQRYHLAPIGLAMDVMEPPVPMPEGSDILFVGGHTVFPKFVSIYQQLGGVQVLGRPLMEARFNPERNRIEQYFENVGFYLLQDALTESVHLLAYGAWECDLECRTSPPLNAIIDFPHESVFNLDIEKNQLNFYIPFLFKEGKAGESAEVTGECCRMNLPIILRSLPSNLLSDAVARLGSDLTGFALTEPYQTPDGKLEQIFENVVVSVDPQNLSENPLLQLPEKLKIFPDSLEKASNDPTMYFYPVQGDQGYNVASYFLYYINLHGGLKVSGPPITKYDLLGDNVYWQCFQYLCMEEHQGTPEGLIIRPVGLGYMYKEIYNQSSNQKIENTATPREVSLQVWEGNPRVASNQEQQIEVSVQENNIPLINIKPTLTLTLPDGTQQSFTLPPTSKEGRTELTLQPISAPNGTLIPYQVCIDNQADEKFCVKDDYLIWNGP
jgi:hypothetical protein